MFQISPKLRVYVENHILMQTKPKIPKITEYSNM